MRSVVLAATLFLLPAVAVAQSLEAGDYLCTVEEKAGIGTNHTESAPPPASYSNHNQYRFRLHVTALAGRRLRIEEAPYSGPGASQYQWEDDNSTLHAPYIGDGRHFTEEDGPGFIDFGPSRWSNDLQFNHASYEYAGGEDETLSVRWGRCAQAH